MIKELAGGIAHDFNNLLTAINGNVSILLNEMPDEGKVRDAVRQIQDASDRAASLTRQLLTFSSRGLMSPRRLNINELLVKFMAMARTLVGESIRLDLDLQADAATAIHADISQMEQIFLNLTVNARDAMPDGGALTIRTRNHRHGSDDSGPLAGFASGPYLELTFADTGQGIDPSKVKHIFEPFFTTKPKGKGTGLGLATVFSIVKRHHGAITAHSKPKGGTKFTLYFPEIE